MISSLVSSAGFTSLNNGLVAALAALACIGLDDMLLHESFDDHVDA